ncbi:MAG: hypothetical protein NVSMB6_00620 [Burkholderiaceae bacterium]
MYGFGLMAGTHADRWSSLAQIAAYYALMELNNFYSHSCLESDDNLCIAIFSLRLSVTLQPLLLLPWKARTPSWRRFHKP